MLRHLLLVLLFSFFSHANIPFAQVITESKSDGTKIEYTYGNDLLSDGTHSFLTDALGSTRGLADSTGALTDSYAYTPYGELANHDGTSENSFLFTGEQRDAETDNYYLRARYYNPTTTRFLSRDTYDGKLIDPISQNHYLYAGANPVMYVDPSGHFLVSTGFGIATLTELYSIPTMLWLQNRVAKNRPSVYSLSFSKWDYMHGILLVITEYYTPGHGNTIALINKLDFLTETERNNYIQSAHIIWGMGYYPNAPMLTTMAQEASFLLLAHYAIMTNEINRLLGAK